MKERLHMSLTKYVITRIEWRWESWRAHAQAARRRLRLAVRCAWRSVARFTQAVAINVLMVLRRDGRRILHVNPSSVTHTIDLNDPTLKGNRPWHLGVVNDGDWDLNGVPVQEYHQLFEILKARVQDGRNFEDIPEYIENLERIKNGGTWYNCATVEKYGEVWRNYEILYHKVADEGYKTQRELHTGCPWDEIRIQIGRHGEMLFEEGLHRLLVAQMLKIESIPVIVYRRHAHWAALRDRVKRIVLKRGFFHQPFNHPDLDVLPQWYGNELKEESLYGNERWDYMTASLPMKTGTVLDIGAYAGYFSHRFEALGFTCTAVELDAENYGVLKQYREVMGKHFKILNCNMFDLVDPDFDIVLALNVFHHLVKTQVGYESLCKFLGNLKCRAMYFEPGDSGSQAYRCFTESEFVDFVLQHSSLRTWKRLGDTKVHRSLYLLTN